MKKSHVVVSNLIISRTGASIGRLSPTHILFTALDPLDDAELCSALLPFDRRKSAAGFYTDYFKRIAQAAKAGCPQIIESREPLLTVELLYAQ